MCRDGCEGNERYIGVSLGDMTVGEARIGVDRPGVDTCNGVVEAGELGVQGIDRGLETSEVDSHLSESLEQLGHLLRACRHGEVLAMAQLLS